MSKSRLKAAAKFSRKSSIGRARSKVIADHAFEPLEMRTMLCGASWHVDPPTAPVEAVVDRVAEAAALKTAAGGPEANDPADIIWTNRGQASDGFAARFGSSAGVARAVVDAVIDYYELMIGSFNYTNAGQTYSLTLSMGTAGSGFGASASLHTSLNGKPKGGAITMGAGTNTADPNDDNGWFLDPTPYDNSEFMGNIVNAFSGDAQAGSPAAGKGDFFTVVAAEMTHCMGLFGSFLSGWSSRTTNTGIADTAEGGGVGTFWTFNGASIDHLLTSNNGGAGGSNFGSAVHGAGPGVNVLFGGNTYVGAQDQGNAVYEFGRRYMVNNTFSLMFKDAYGYSSINPSKFGTFYSSPFDSTTGVVTVRGGTGTSNDNIQIFRSAGNTLTVAVDVGNDVAGTGSLPGAGNLPAFVSVYDISQVSSIVVDAGAGDDVIFIDTTNFSAALAKSISITAGSGNDSLTVGFFGQNLDFFTSPMTFDGGTGTDSITIYDNGATFSDTYTLTSTTLSRIVYGGLTYSGCESFALNAESGSNIFNIGSTAAGASYIIDGRAGSDTFNIGSATSTVAAIAGPISIVGGADSDTVNYIDSLNAAATSYTVTNTTVSRTGAALVTFGTAEALVLNSGSNADTVALNTGSGQIPMTIRTNGGNDAVNIDVSGYTVLGSQSPITLDTGANTDTVTLNTASGGVFYNVTAAAFTGTFAPSYSYNNQLENLVINGGTGGETFLLFETPATLSTVVNGNEGADSIYFGGFFGAAYTLDSILGPVAVNGNNGSDVIGLIDTQATAAKTFNVASTTISRSGAALITYGTTERVELYGGSAGDTFNINSTAAATTSMLVNANGGADTINVIDHAAATVITVDGGAGLDTVDVNTDTVGTASVHFASTQDLALLSIHSGGTAVMDVDGNRVINTAGLNIVGTGKLDLNDNDLLLDYSGATQYGLVQSKITSGRNGGLWNGSGIISTSAKNRVPKNTTLGILEATDYKQIFGAGALFDGQIVDPTAVLVKYTYYGDTDFNGVVNFDDYSRADAGFNGSKSGWINGDFDGNGIINFDDYSLIDLAFNSQLAAL